MPHIWSSIKDGEEESWRAVSLEKEGCVLSFEASGPRFQPLPCPGSVDSADLVVQPAVLPGARPQWMLVANRNTDVRVNGQVLVLGLRRLRDQDEIHLAGERLFFSEEELACVVPFPDLAQPAFCPRCKQKIELNESAVCCPCCQAWSHQSEKLPCWTYDKTCALCQQQATALDAGFKFNPMDL